MIKTVFAQISRRCNLRCVMCGHEAWQRNAGFMSDDVFDLIIAEMRACGINRMALTAAQGEPLLAPKALSFVGRALGAGLAVHINTNCTPLNRGNCAGLALAAVLGDLTIQCSFAGHNQETYERIYVGADFAKTAAKLKLLYNTFAEVDRERAITVRGIVYDKAEEAKTRAFIHWLGIPHEQIYLEIPDNFAGLVRNTRDLTNLELYTCPWLEDYVVVYDDGKVSACACRDSEGVMLIGDLMTQSLADIIASRERQKMLEAFACKDVSGMPLCSKCDVPYRRAAA